MRTVCLFVDLPVGSSVWNSGRCGTLMTRSRGFNVDGRAEPSRSCVHACISAELVGVSVCDIW